MANLPLRIQYLLMGDFLKSSILLVFGAAASMLLSACGSDPENPISNAEIRVGVRVLNPQVTDGLAQLQFDLPSELQSATGELSVDGRKVTTLKSFGGTFFLQVKDLQDGPHQVVLHAVSQSSGEEGWGEEIFTVQNPTVGVAAVEAPDVVYPGFKLEIDLEVTGSVASVTADLSELIPGSRPASFFTFGDGTYRLRHRLPDPLTASEGWYSIPIFVTGTDGRSASFPDVQVFLASAPLLPLVADSGVLERGTLPAGDDLKARATVRQISGELSVVTGGAFQLELDLQGSAAGAQALIGIEGRGGHLAIPISEAEAQAGHATLSLQMPKEAQLPGQKGALKLQVALRDAQGQVSGVRGANVSYGVAREGNLRITLSWDTPTDVDLYAVTPKGTEIYYRNTSDGLGGKLDLDSNPDCKIDNVNHENVYWDLPRSGEYVVRVNYYEACNNLSANWRVTVQGCGLNLEKTGRFAPSQATGGGRGAGLEVLRFQAACKPYRVSGKAEYELPTENGATRTQPLSNVPFRVVDASGNELGKGKVGNDGQYTLLFSQPAAGATTPVMLEFLSSDDTVSVVKVGGTEPHEARPLAAWVPNDVPDKKADVLIKLDAPSGPFHLFRTLYRGVRFIAGRGYPLPGKTVAQWSFGQEPGTHYSRVNDSLSINGHEGNPDEFDDSVILHELGHRVMTKFSRHDSPGVAHTMTPRIVPSQAWSEGFATYFGQQVLDTPRYTDRYKGGHMKFYLKPLDSGVELGTSDNMDSGNISESTVAGLLWYLQDGLTPSENDLVAGMEGSWFPVFVSQMKSDANLQAGTPGEADLADLIKLWACRLDADSKGKVSTLMERRFNLDWLGRRNFCGN
jgi:hypothetical protein